MNQTSSVTKPQISMHDTWNWLWRVEPEEERGTRPYDCYDIITWNSDDVEMNLTYSRARDIVEAHNKVVWEILDALQS